MTVTEGMTVVSSGRYQPASRRSSRRGRRVACSTLQVEHTATSKVAQHSIVVAAADAEGASVGNGGGDSEVDCVGGWLTS